MAARKKNHLDRGNVITLSGVGAAEGDIEFPWEERNFCVSQVLSRAKRVKKVPRCKDYYDWALEACMKYKFPKADKWMGELEECLLDAEEDRPLRRR